MDLPALASRRARRRVKQWRFRATRRAGSDRYTWAAINGLDHKLVALLGTDRPGTFVELGGNDGLQQSNTLALETLYGWRGLLIEADPELAAECGRNRPLATVVCAAAGSDWGFARLARADLVGSLSSRPPGDIAADAPTALVPTAPLSEIIAAALDRPIDLLSVDVEGYELEVLAGLDLDRHAPAHLLVETADPDAVGALLGARYVYGSQLSPHDHHFSSAG